MHAPSSGFACLMMGSSDGTDLRSAFIGWGTHWLSGDWLLSYRLVHGGSGICSELRTVNGSSRGLQLQDFIVLKLAPSPCAHLSLELAFVSRAFQTSPENLTAFVFLYVSCLRCPGLGNRRYAMSRRLCSLPDDSICPNRVMMVLFNS